MKHRKRFFVKVIFMIIIYRIKRYLLWRKVRHHFNSLEEYDKECYDYYNDLRQSRGY